jgi:DNA-directed RNA polymerase specialized sigma24 family protein
MLRRYLYASMQVGRSPEVLQNSVGRGWVSSRRVSTFEDAVIFVMDIERCLARLSRAERLLLERVILQEYTYPEAADLMGMSVRVLARKIPEALDKLTELLVKSKLLLLTD